MDDNRLTPLRDWSLLLLLSAGLIAALHFARLPAAFLLGALIAAIVLAARGKSFPLPAAATLPAQAVLGCMISGIFTPPIFAAFAQHWPVLIAAAVIPIGAAAFAGWLLSRLQVLPSSTGVWGAFPGAATAMVLMSESFGADVRLVAFMQYLRVLCVALVASLVGFLATNGHGAAHVATDWFPVLKPLAFATALGVVTVGAGLGRVLPVPAGALLIPMVIAAAIHLSGIAELQLPQWLLVMAYTVLGWNIGLRFTTGSLRHAWRSLPAILTSILSLIAFCGGVALIVSQLLRIDLLTAYLATSPGGADSIAIIAASSHVDIAMVMAVQVVRFLIVALLGPRLAQAVASTLPRATAQTSPAAARSRA